VLVGSCIGEEVSDKTLDLPQPSKTTEATINTMVIRRFIGLPNSSNYRAVRNDAAFRNDDDAVADEI